MKHYSYTVNILTILYLTPVIVCVLNGIPASPGEFPYMAALMVKKVDIVNCGGAIITRKLILTTAHCICNKWSYKNYYVRVGSNNLNEKGSRYELDKSICHEYFDPRTLANDIGIVRTIFPIIFNNRIEVIALQKEPIPPRSFLIGLGWGCLQKHSENYPQDLRYNFLEVINQPVCDKIFWNSTIFNFICTETNTFSGMCSGDSGSPVTYNGRLAGICYGGGYNSPDLFLNISKFNYWIYKQIYTYNRDQYGVLYNDAKYVNIYYNIYNARRTKRKH